MDPTSPQVWEGRLIAQRKVLAEIVARIGRADRSLLDALEDRTVASVPEEDPGAGDASGAFAIEAAAAEEVRLILETARRRMGPG